jgi:hypothetical protein
MAFRMQGLATEHFTHLFHGDESTLRAFGAERHVVHEKPGAPCRISLEDADIGETVLLLNHAHQSAATPYRQNGPIFVRERACARFDARDVIAPALAARLLSLRAFTTEGAMINADVVQGVDLATLIEAFFNDSNVAYMHAHYARRGCYAALITRT